MWTTLLMIYLVMLIGNKWTVRHTQLVVKSVSTWWMNQEWDVNNSKKTAYYANCMQTVKAKPNEQWHYAQLVRVRTLTDTHAFFSYEKNSVFSEQQENFVELIAPKKKQIKFGYQPHIASRSTFSCQYQPDRASTTQNRSTGLGFRPWGHKNRSNKSDGHQPHFASETLFVSTVWLCFQ